MITPERFLVSKAKDPNEWHNIRKTGVSATTVAKAATPAGFTRVIAEWATDTSINNDYTKFGNDSEDSILKFGEQHGIFANDWLIAGENKHHFATPDGLSKNHNYVAEAKTTGKPWDGVAEGTHQLPVLYRRQIQWQLHCTGAEKCLVLWQLRVPNGNGWYTFGWNEPRTLWIERDEKMIKTLVETATKLEEKLHDIWLNPAPVPQQVRRYIPPQVEPQYLFNDADLPW